MTALALPDLTATAARLRSKTVRASFGPGHHLGGALSCIEILTAIFFSTLPKGRSTHFVMSKGHAVVPMLLAIEMSGSVGEPVADVTRPDLIGHPSRTQMPGVEVSTGSLGQGLSIGTGIALGERLAASGRGVVVVAGDGEMQEGQSWEAMSFAGVQQLTNLCVVIDANDAQADGDVPRLLQGSFPPRFQSLGFDVVECDGHDLEALVSAIATEGLRHPRVVVAHTVKGKGVSFMERSPEWFTGTLDSDSMWRALRELQEVTHIETIR